MVINKWIKKVKLYYSASDTFRGLIKNVTGSSLYFWLMKQKIKHQRCKDKDGPFNLIIETSNICNAGCVMCPYQYMQRSKKIMDQVVFDKIIERIQKERLPINKVFFSGMGEPLTDKQIINRIAKVKSLGLKIRLYTNASLLREEVAQQLVFLGVDEINISFNGTNSKEYKQIMGLSFEQAVANINNLLKVKRLHRSKKPVVQISSIVMGKNKQNIKRHIQNWQDKVESVTVSLTHQWGGGVKIRSGFEIKNNKRVYPCRSLWHTFVIDSQGNFVLCCRDYESRYVLGNVMTDSFAQIQKSPILKKIRRLHLEYAWEKLPKMCQRCNFPYQDGVEWLMPRALD